jgi:uncharacterized UPF0160 family protein
MLRAMLVVKKEFVDCVRYYASAAKSVGTCQKSPPAAVLSAKVAAGVVRIGTRDGKFGCADVLACAMLRALPQYKSAEIVRTSEGCILQGCDVVVGVGGVFRAKKKRFDCHQDDFAHTVASLVPGKSWTTRLSSAGLIFVHFGTQLVSAILKNKDRDLVENVFDIVYANFVEAVDAQEHNIPQSDEEPRYRVCTDLTARVARLSNFSAAVALVGKELADVITFYGQVWWPARAFVARAFRDRYNVHESGRIVVLRKGGGCPFVEHLFKLEEEEESGPVVTFVIFDTYNFGKSSVRSVPVRGRQFESRLLLHPEWRALRGEELCLRSGIKGCKFVHFGGFIGANDTREGAVEMAVKSMQAAGMLV